ncbi:MAG TPA: FecR domain-containing protein, partial [Chitinophagaceae bacterium]
MLPDNDRLTYLFHRYLDDRASEEELEELGAYIRQASEQSPLKAQITAVFQQIRTEESFDYVKWDEMFFRIIGGSSLESAAPPAREAKIFSWTRAAAAAAILLLLGTGTYFLFFPGQKRPQRLVHSLQSNKNDVAAPNRVKAVLTLSNGHKIIIDSAEHGAIAMQGNTNIVKLANGQIAYNVAAKSTNEVMYNTLTVPRGSKVIAITLADGTKVWLNAASSLRYPTAFSGRERRVEITGEAYFEVMHNTNMPFIVENGGAEIQVLGTHFDVNAYDDEAIMKVTLLEGSVRIIKGNSRQQLIPGQQAQVNAD